MSLMVHAIPDNSRDAKYHSMLMWSTSRHFLSSGHSYLHGGPTTIGRTLIVECNEHVVKLSASEVFSALVRCTYHKNCEICCACSDVVV